MITLKLKKRSSGKKATYSIQITDKANAVYAGNFLDKVGNYAPLLDLWTHKYVYLDFDTLRHYLNHGASLDKNLYTLVRPLMIYHTIQSDLQFNAN